MTKTVLVSLVLISVPLYITVLCVDPWLAQAGIILYGLPTLVLVGFKNSNIRRWGYITALLGQPFWFIATLHNDQWGMLILVCCYTITWINGIHQHWIKNENIADSQP